MERAIKIPKSFPNANALEEVVNHLIVFLHTDAVYISEVFEKTLISIIITDGYFQDLDELQNIKLIEDHPEIIFKFFTADWTRHAFKKGIPYFIMHCTIDKLAYCLPDSKVFYPTAVKTKYFTYRLRKRKGEMSWSIDTQIRNYKNFMGSGRTTEAAYSLHQAMRSVFMCFSENFGDAFIGSHDLTEQYNWVNEFVPFLKDMIETPEINAPEALSLLNEVYDAIINKKNIEIDPINLKSVFGTVERINSELNLMFMEMYANYKVRLKSLISQPFTGIQILENKVTSNYVVEQALGHIDLLIREYIKTRNVFCVGYNVLNTEKAGKKKGYYSPGLHFYLLVYTLEPKDNAAAIIEAKVRDAFNKKYKVTILLHRKQALPKKRINDRWFLNKLAVNGIQAGSSLEIIDRPFERDVEHSAAYWRNRARLAESLFTTLKTMSEPNEALLKNTLLHEAMVNICLGIIELYLAYRPNRTNLGHLFALIKFITGKDFSQDFQQEDDNAMYLLLSANPEMIRYKEVDRYYIEDSNEIEKLCREFFWTMKDLACSKLNEFHKTNQIL